MKNRVIKSIQIGPKYNSNFRRQLTVKENFSSEALGLKHSLVDFFGSAVTRLKKFK